MEKYSNSKSYFLRAIFVLSIFAAALAVGEDWPAWRYDAARSAATAHTLPEKMHLQWIHHLPRQQKAWEEDIGLNPGLQFDVAYQPVVADGILYFASTVNDSVTALNADDGEVLWRHYAEAPVRFAPVVWDGRVYFGSDDGRLYCVDAYDGKLQWKFRGAPGKHMALGNKRLSSLWPVRGAPVIADETIYFAAGIWPFMGVSIYALEAETGEIVWINDSAGQIPTVQPHGGRVMAGAAPQGYLVVSGDKLLVPNGRTLPAAFNRHTGEFLYFDMESIRSGKGVGGFEVAACEYFWYNSGYTFDIIEGESVMNHGRHGNWQGDIPDGGVLYSPDRNVLNAFDISEGPRFTKAKDRRGDPIDVYKPLSTLWSFNMGKRYDLFLKADNRLYLGRPGRILSIELSDDGGKPTFAWQQRIEGRPKAMAAAGGRLYVSTREGHIYCFGDKKAEPVNYIKEQIRPSIPEKSQERVADILQQTALQHGYALVLGIETGNTALALACQSDFNVIVLEPDEEKINRFRRRANQYGLYGERLHALTGTVSSLQMPPYLASLVISENVEPEKNVSLVDALPTVLRPYGGRAILNLTDDAHSEWQEYREINAKENYSIEQAAGRTIITREGPPSGSDQWTHSFGDAANTLVSGDSAVRSPLGILWYGGPVNPKLSLPPQVAGGRQFLLRRESIRAFDVYTGKLLWEKQLPGLGPQHGNDYLLLNGPLPKRPSTDNLQRGKMHYPGARALPVGHVSLQDAVYVAYDRHCHRLNPASGEIIDSFSLPPNEGETEGPAWGYLRASGDYLIATSFGDPEQAVLHTDSRSGRFPPEESLFVLDRHTGEVIWHYESQNGLFFEAVAVADNMVFLIDAPYRQALDQMERRGEERTDTPKLMALGLNNGELQWELKGQENVFGSWLSYSTEHGVLLQAGGGRLDGRRVAVYDGRDGTLRWDRDHRHRGPLIIHGETLINQRSGAASAGRPSFDLLTGRERTVAHPLTGRDTTWQYHRNYGCGPATAGENLLFFRSATAAYYDLTRKDGTSHLGGFRSGCTQNLTAADGVLSAPDMTGTCNCTFHNQTSLAMVSMPELESWHRADAETLIHRDSERRMERMGRIRQTGINFGAPGVRRDEKGTYWVNYPETVPAPVLKVEVEGAVNWFRRNSLRLSGEKYPWVHASGLDGEALLNIYLPGDEQNNNEGMYTVRFYFAEPEGSGQGERVFDVFVQGERVIKDLDIALEAGPDGTALVREVTGIKADEQITLQLESSGGAKPPVLSGVEILCETSNGMNRLK